MADAQAASLPNVAVRALASAMQATGQHRAAKLLRNVRKTSAGGLSDILGDRITYLESFMAALDAGGYDLVLSPAAPLPAAPHGVTKDLPDAFMPAALFTTLGMPAGVLPLTRVRPGEESDRHDSKDRSLQAARRVEQGSAGLPVGVQIVARHWREDLVLAAMQAIETEISSLPDHPGLPPR